jgi:hypothetical protein
MAGVVARLVLGFRIRDRLLGEGFDPAIAREAGGMLNRVGLARHAWRMVRL